MRPTNMYKLHLTGLALLTLALSAQAQERPGTIPVTQSPMSQSQLMEVEGKTRHEWMKDLKSPDPGVLEPALVAITKFPPTSEAISLVLNICQKERGDASPRVRAVMALHFMDIPKEDVLRVVTELGKRVEDQQAVVRYHAAFALQKFGEDAKPALLHLIKGIDDPVTWEIRRACVVALIPCGRVIKGAPDPRVQNALIKATRDQSAAVRLEAAMGLGAIGRTTDPLMEKEIEKTLLPLFKEPSKFEPDKRDPDKRVVIWAQFSYMSIAKVDNKIIESIARETINPDAEVRRVALQALGAMGPASRPHLAFVLDALTDKEPKVVFAACWTLQRIEERTAGVLSALEEVVRRKDIPEECRQMATATIEQLKKMKKDK
jgi:HEAT repeat protein